MTHQTVDATIEPVQDPSKRYRCRHIFIDGHRCGSPSLRGEHLCYYHHVTRGFAEEKRLRREWAEFELPPLEDRSSVLAAVTEVLQRIACDKLPAKQAGLLLYGLQIASNNLPETESKSTAKSANKSAPKLDNQPVEQVLVNPRYGDLAPVAEIAEDTNILPNLNASAAMAHPKPVILSEASRSFTASGAIEGPAVALVPASFTHAPNTRHLDRRPNAAVDRPLYFALSTSYPPTPATNPPLPTNPEINTPTPAPTPAAWYPNICHAYEKRTSRPPHSAHRHQAAQRRRSRRRHELHGLQLA